MFRTCRIGVEGIVIFDAHLRTRGKMSTVVYRKGDATVRSVRLGRPMCIWNGRMITDDGGSYSMWDTVPWSPTTHARYSREIRYTIRTWMIISRKRNLLRDVALSIRSEGCGRGFHFSDVTIRNYHRSNKSIPKNDSKFDPRTRLEKSICSYE